MQDPDLVARAARFHPWDAMAPAALAALLQRGPFGNTAETGCGGSTIVLSHAAQNHTAFAIEGDNRTISTLRSQTDLRAENVTFVEGETRHTLPTHSFQNPLDLILLDGPHAYPLPQLEFIYLFPNLNPGGWLVLDDLQIHAVHELFRFLKKESSVTLEEIALRTAFFRRIAATEPSPDGWQRQGINRRPILRYCWRDRLRHWF